MGIITSSAMDPIKHYYPDHYPLGYLMVQYGNAVFGEATWDTIFREAPRMKPIYDPFSGVCQTILWKESTAIYISMPLPTTVSNGRLRKVDGYYLSCHSTHRKKPTQMPFFDMAYPDVAGDGSIYSVDHHL